MELKLNKAVPTPERLTSEEGLAWLGAVLGEDVQALATPEPAAAAPAEEGAAAPESPADVAAEPVTEVADAAPVATAPALAIEFDRETWRLAWTLRESVRMRLEALGG